jgi:hypothetical protein
MISWRHLKEKKIGFIHYGITSINNMTPEINSHIRAYADIKAQIKELEKKAESIKEVLEGHLQVDARYDLGDAVVAYMPGRVTYQYSVAVQEADESLKQAKKEEEQTGIAKPVEGKPFIQVNFPRGKK